MGGPAPAVGAPVVVGCADTPSARAALLFAGREARLRGAQLIVVLAFEPASDPDLAEFEMDPGRRHQQAERTAQRCVDELVERLGAAAPGVTTSVARGTAAEVLLDAARTAAMLVLGARSESRLTRLLQGSTTAQVLHRARVPVVVVPAPAAPEASEVGSGNG